MKKMLEMKNTVAKIMTFLGLINKTFVAAEQEFCQSSPSSGPKIFLVCPPCTTHGVLNMLGFPPVIGSTVSHINM